MKQNGLFSEQEREFEKRCRRRILVQKLLFLLGALAVFASLMYEKWMPVLYLEQGGREYVEEFYQVLGIALMAASLVQMYRTRRCLRDPELKKAKQLAENDERNRLIGLKAWAVSGYAMFLLLYLGVLVSGFVSATVSRVLLVTVAVFAAVLGISRLVIGRQM